MQSEYKHNQRYLQSSCFTNVKNVSRLLLAAALKLSEAGIIKMIAVTSPPFPRSESDVNNGKRYQGKFCMNSQSSYISLTDTGSQQVFSFSALSENVHTLKSTPDFLFFLRLP